MGHFLNKVPIFKVGHHNGFEFKDSDLTQMATNFAAYKAENSDWEIPVKIGHHKDGGSAPGSERPAMGWVDNIHKDGDFLFADFKDMDAELFDQLRRKRYKGRSVEMVMNAVNSKGQEIGKFIRAVAILGTSMPAVNLPDMKFQVVAFSDQAAEVFAFDHEDNDLYPVTREVESEESKEFAEVINESIETDGTDDEPIEDEKSFKAEDEGLLVQENFKGGDEMDELKAVAGEPDKVMQIIDTYKAKTAEAEKIIAEANEKQRQFEQEEVKAFCLGLIKENKIVPAEREAIENLFFSFEPKEINFEQGDLKIKVSTTQRDLFKTFLSQLPDRGMFSKQSVSSNFQETKAKDFTSYVKDKGFSNPSKLTKEEFKDLMVEYKALNPDFLREAEEN